MFSQKLEANMLVEIYEKMYFHKEETAWLVVYQFGNIFYTEQSDISLNTLLGSEFNLWLNVLPITSSPYTSCDSFSSVTKLYCEDVKLYDILRSAK